MASSFACRVNDYCSPTMIPPASGTAIAYPGPGTRIDTGYFYKQ